MEERYVCSSIFPFYFPSGPGLLRDACRLTLALGVDCLRLPIGIQYLIVGPKGHLDPVQQPFTDHPPRLDQPLGSLLDGHANDSTPVVAPVHRFGNASMNLRLQSIQLCTFWP